MEFTSNRIKKESNEKKYKNRIHKNKRVSHSPILLYRNFIKCFFIKENILNKGRINNNSQRPKSENINRLNKSSKSQKKSSKIYKSRKTYYRNNIQINETIKQNSINNIQKKMTSYPQQIKKNENKKIIKNMYTKERRLTNRSENINNLRTSTKVSNKKIIHKINKIEKITPIKKIQINTQIKNGYKKLLHPKSKNVGLSLDNIISKRTINKIKTKIKTNSYDNNKPITIKKTPNIKIKHMENKLNTEKIIKNKKYIRTKHNQIKSENINLIKIKNSCQNNKTERKVDNSNKSTTRNKRNINNINKKYDSNNDSKLLSDNVSTNYKSINTKKVIKSNKNDINTTPNIVKKKNVKLIKKFNDNTFKMLELMKENDGEEKINGVKINNFDIKKPRDENLKFTFVKDDKQCDLSVSRASKVIIGKIEGYRDIIETDKEKNHYKIYSNLYNKKLNKLNLINYLSNSNKNSYKKLNNCSNILKKENDSITFNDDEFYENLGISNNWDGMSSTNTNNKITGIKIEKNNYDYNNDSYYLKTEQIPGMNFMNSKNEKNYSKKYNNNLIDITIDDCSTKKKMIQNSDNCIII